MGILDWFKNRPAQFDPERTSAEMRDGAIDKAVTLTNPRLRVIPSYHSQLAPAVETTIDYLRTMARSLPPARPVSAASWAADPALRAFFAAPAEMVATLARADNLRTLFGKFPELDQACFVLGMAFSEQKVFGVALQGDVVHRDVAQTSVSFSDHRAHLCNRDESRLRRTVGVEAFEHLLGRALAEIGEERVERQQLEANRALVRSRLRLLQQQGPGLGAMFGSPPAAREEQARLEAELLENDRQLEAIGDSQSALTMELESLCEVLSHPERYLQITRKRLRLNTLNVVVDASNGELSSEVDFSMAELLGPPPVKRAFMLASVTRNDIPAAPAIDFDRAASLL
ncbi:MAG: hypothetical protein E6R11_02115 [Rhodocyclaceae bacterium]|nr:MAG: hypothetical protein E6R11_02115 [Rhodocyclaceae bacterium]